MTQGASAAGRYQAAGVDIDAGSRLVAEIGPVAAATRRPGWLGGLGGFGGLFDLKACGFADPVLVAATDGVGTKLLLAAAHGGWRQVGVDLVAMSVNDLVVQGAEPLFFLDYLATGRLDTAIAGEVVRGIGQGCRTAGCALIGGETAEMPGLYAPGHLDLAGFAVGAVERGAVLPRHAAMAEGDVLLGLASSGIHANGFSLVRQILREAGWSLDVPAPFDPEWRLGDALLEPTRIYVPACLAAIRAGGVNAVAHITGGGLVDNPPRMLPPDHTARIDVRAWPLPPLFTWLAAAGRLAPMDLARTFNCGLGMVLCVAAEAAPALVDRLEAAGERVFRIGEVIRRAGPAAVELVHLDETWPGAPPS